MIVITLAIGLTLLGIVCPSDRKVTFLILLFMWSLFAFNTANGDYTPYQTIYNRIGAGDLWGTTVQEPGFVYLSYYCYNTLRLDFQEFIILFSTICTILLAIVTRLYMRAYQNIALLLFMYLNYWMMICQTRSYLATLLVLLGIYFLFSDKSWKGMVGFAALDVMAALFHSSVLLYLPLLLIRKFKIKYVVFLTIGVSIVFFAMRYGLFGGVVSSLISDYKSHWVYGEGVRSAAGIALLVLVRLVLIAIEVLAYKGLAKSPTADKRALASLDAIIKVTIICLAYIAFEMYNENFERLFRVPLFLSFVFFAQYLTISRSLISEKKYSGGIQAIMVAFVLFYVLYLVYFYAGYSGWFVHNLIPIVYENSLFGFV